MSKLSATTLLWALVGTLAVSPALLSTHALAFPGEITTYAGTGSGGDTGDGGLATAAKIQRPRAQALDVSGNLYFADTDNHRIRRIAAGTGIITTVAGNGSQGFLGDGGAATAARLRFPRGVAVAANGDIYIADTENHRIRLVTAATGIITTVAGNGTEGDSGDGGAATSASLDEPHDVALDLSGRLTIADTDNHRIRRVSAGGIITTIAGNGDSGFGGDDGPATSAKINHPSGIGYDISGDLYIADTENNRVRKVNVSVGTIRTFAGTGTSGYSGDGGSATNAKLKKPSAVALDASRHLYIADNENHRVRRVEHGTGTIMTIAGTGLGTYDGDGVPAVSASIRNPDGLVVDAAGDVLIGDTQNHRIRRVEDPPFTECGDGTLEIGEECDDGNTSSGDCCSSSCKIESATTQCRASADLCDAPEFCDGVTPTCPADFPRPGGTTCRAAAGTCDVAEVCDGVSSSCPADTTVAAGTECRASAGPCDIAEQCTGAPTCPIDSFVTAGTTCRAAAGTCDLVEVCTGISAACPVDVTLPAGTECRAAAGACDIAEQCTGGATCPADVVVASGTTCRASAGLCDVTEICDGVSSSCPADVTLPAGTECRGSAGGCDLAEQCTGAAACPADSFVASGTTCRASGGACDPEEVCSGSDAACPADTLHDSSTVCRAAADLCDATELCSGVDPTCPADGLKPDGTVCRSAAGVCDVAETCDGASTACPADALVPAGTECRASTDPGCDPSESCTGANAFCPGDYIEPDGTMCDDGDPLTENETCIVGMCGCLGDDLDGDTIPDSCDLVDAPIEVSKVTAKWGKVGRGLVTAGGTFEVGPLGPGDVFDVATGLIVSVSDSGQPGYAQAVFLPEECGTSPNGTVKCKTMDKSAIAKFKRKEIAEGIFEYKYKIRIKGLDLMTALTAPVEVAIEIGVLDRVGDISFCFPKTSGLRCKQ